MEPAGFHCFRSALCRSASSRHGIHFPLFSCVPSQLSSLARASAAACVVYIPFPWAWANSIFNANVDVMIANALMHVVVDLKFFMLNIC